jgi:hypothetical protein
MQPVFFVSGIVVTVFIAFFAVSFLHVNTAFLPACLGYSLHFFVVCSTVPIFGTVSEKC